MENIVSNKKCVFSENINTDKVIFFGGDIMDIKSAAKGAAAGTAVGIMCYYLTSSAPVKKHSIKKSAGKTLKAAEDLLMDIASTFM